MENSGPPVYYEPTDGTSSPREAKDFGYRHPPNFDELR